MGLFGLFSSKKEELIVEEKSSPTDFSEFLKVTNYIYEKSGITDLDTRALTSSRIQQFAKEEGVYTTNKLLVKMKNSTSFYQEVMNIATVNETFFMRELKELEWLVNYIKSLNRNLKILSIPSSSGEEIYSILIMLMELGVDINSVDIQGYDINSHAIKNANDGIYEEHSVHKLDETLRKKYFTREKYTYKIINKIKSRSHFSQKNIFDIADENSKYDIVLSRNMFIYFDDVKRATALDKIVNCLKVGGIYIKGHADYIKKHQNLDNIKYGIYKKI